MIKNVSKVLDEKSNEIINHDSQDSSTFQPSLETHQENLFSFDPSSFSLKFHKNLTIYHAIGIHLLKLSTKPAFTQEKKEPWSTNNGADDQEAHQITTTHSKFKVDYHDAEMTSNPYSNGELTSESSSFTRVDSAIKDESVIIENKEDKILRVESKTSTKVF